MASKVSFLLLAQSFRGKKSNFEIIVETLKNSSDQERVLLKYLLHYTTLNSMVQYRIVLTRTVVQSTIIL